jgi:myosin-crossreactive antigen
MLNYYFFSKAEFSFKKWKSECYLRKYKAKFYLEK